MLPIRYSILFFLQRVAQKQKPETNKEQEETESSEGDSHIKPIQQVQ